MNCQRCKKALATVHLTDITNHENREKHLCDRCAQEEGVSAKPQQLHLNELLTHFVMQQPNVQELAQLTCPHCRMTFVEFRNGGLLGCPHDYEVFERALLPLIEKAHEGHDHHIGKAPRGPGTTREFKDELLKLRRNLAQAVEQEDYETAARLRDRIQTIESQ